MENLSDVLRELNTTACAVEELSYRDHIGYLKGVDITQFKKILNSMREYQDTPAYNEFVRLIRSGANRATAELHPFYYEDKFLQRH